MQAKQVPDQGIQTVETTLAELISFLQDLVLDDAQVVAAVNTLMAEGRMRRPHTDT